MLFLTILPTLAQVNPPPEYPDIPRIVMLVAAQRCQHRSPSTIHPAATVGARKLASDQVGTLHWVRIHGQLSAGIQNPWETLQLCDQVGQLSARFIRGRSQVVLDSVERIVLHVHCAERIQEETMLLALRCHGMRPWDHHGTWVAWHHLYGAS